MHTINDESTRTAALAVWVDPSMSRRATVAQRVTRAARRTAWYGVCALALVGGYAAGTLIQPLIYG